MSEAITPTSNVAHCLAQRMVASRLAVMWLARQTETSVSCEACGASNAALAVGERIYRWSCIACAWQSRWFRVVEGDLRVLGLTAVQILATGAP